MTLKIASLAALGLLALAGGAHAQDAWQAPRAGDWLITGRITDVAPTTDDAIITSAGVDSGLEVDVGAVAAGVFHAVVEKLERPCRS